LAIIVGTILTMILVSVATYLAIIFLLDPAPEGLVFYVTPTFTVVSLGYALASALSGGWVAAALGGSHAAIHGASVGILLLIPIAWGRGAPGPGQPGWYPWVFGLVVLAGSVTGAILWQRRWQRV
jgi:uncharacterized protein YqgC (DUF456 family)